MYCMIGAAMDGQIVTLEPIELVVACDCYSKVLVFHAHSRVIVDTGLTTALTLP